MNWVYKEDNGDSFRTCDLCGLTQIKCKDGEWAIYITMGRINKFFENVVEGIKETCVHTPDENSK